MREITIRVHRAPNGWHVICYQDGLAKKLRRDDKPEKPLSESEAYKIAAQAFEQLAAQAEDREKQEKKP